MNKVIHSKSLAKAISWRLLSSTVTWIATYSITHSLYYATSLSVFEIIGKIGLYYCHERLWESRFNGKLSKRAVKQYIKKFSNYKMLSKKPLL